ncbi:LacI family DNA-binding transcriptional regulator [Mitsuokella sp.]|uniref:LacI family DNA-binding transcriptional regulator n=1 Tax=Mitsuokella TaxID=52225 RepID=UPI0029E3A280|nr:LacI family DNA-binding transcriptional regulator [Mitsuokella sp.]MDD6383420.1 LacI family DNA-binding transcriptional regulator [Selenomonadaceae bacterium]MDY4475475.1 LacI family DNA-binding transcriptional regulator [Mitsuokella sp.]
MGTKVTIKDVAELAGVSKSTVSRYLNRGYISVEKQERVREAIEKTGFQSNFFAKRLKTKQSKLIGIVLPRMDSVTVGKLLTGISRIFEPAGYQGILLVSHLSSTKEIENIRNLQQQGVDGILVDSVGITEEHLALSNATSVPILYTGQRHEGVPCIKIDDYQAGRMVGAYLRQMGHKRAVFAGVTESDQAVGVERKQGFLAAFTEHRPDAQVDFVETGFDFLSAYNRAADIVQLQPTVIVGATDNISLGVLRYLHERGIRVPEQISVVGFGGYDVGAVVYPALTTVAFDYELMGMKAAQYLLDLLADREPEGPMEMPIFFIERESVRNIQEDFEPQKPSAYASLT